MINSWTRAPTTEGNGDGEVDLTFALKYEEARDVWVSLTSDEIMSVLGVDEARLRHSFEHSFSKEEADEAMLWWEEFVGNRTSVLRESLALLFCFLHGKWTKGNTKFDIPALEEHFRRVDLATRAGIKGRASVEREAIAVVYAASPRKSCQREHRFPAPFSPCASIAPARKYLGIFASSFLRELDRNLAMLAAWQTWSLGNLVLQLLYSVFLLTSVAIDSVERTSTAVHMFSGRFSWVTGSFGLVLLVLMTSSPRHGIFWMSELGCH